MRFYLSKNVLGTAPPYERWERIIYIDEPTSDNHETFFKISLLQKSLIASGGFLTKDSVKPLIIKRFL